LRFVTTGFRGIVTSMRAGLTDSRSGSGTESITMVSPSFSQSKVNVGADDGGMVPTIEVGTIEEA
jgi:hypothetical protein